MRGREYHTGKGVKEEEERGSKKRVWDQRKKENQSKVEEDLSTQNLKFPTTPDMTATQVFTFPSMQMRLSIHQNMLSC